MLSTKIVNTADMKKVETGGKRKKGVFIKVYFTKENWANPYSNWKKGSMWV